MSTKRVRGERSVKKGSTGREKVCERGRQREREREREMGEREREAERVVGTTIRGCHCIGEKGERGREVTKERGRD